MRYPKLLQRFALIGLLMLGSPAGSVWAEIVLKILVVNPSETETKEFTIHSALPPEVKAGDVLETDGLSVEYDSNAGLYVLSGTVTLEPKQSLSKQIVLEDVWVIPDKRFAAVREETDTILAKLAKTPYEEQGQLLADSVDRRLTAVEASERQPFVNPEQHISLYRDNLKALQSIEVDLVSLRQLMVMAALEPSGPSLLGGSGTAAGGTEHGRGSLSILTTWKLIFIILSLLGLVSLSFFIVWQRQLKLQLAKQAARDDETADEGLFTNGNGTRHADAPPALQARVQPKSPLSS
ncbi:MAG: hypothetical protein Q8R78_04715 [Candidatus Omnitrophota bacterium]|nr:hypothetical protein [Candidatus Omnitrophota bacterium]